MFPIATFGTILALTIASPVGAQNTSGATVLSTPAEKYAVAPGGVDLRTGRYVYNQTDLTIGDDNGAGSLKLARTITQNVPGHAGPFGNLSHNWDITITEYRIIRDVGPYSYGNDYRLIVSLGGRSETFDAYADTGFTQMSQDAYGSLTWTGDRASGTAVYTYTDSEGRTFTFRPIGSGDCSTGQRCADIASVTDPDGTLYTFDYAATGLGNGDNARLARVSSSRGYAILLEGAGALVTKACALNLSVTTVPANGVCPGGVPTASYVYDNAQRLTSATDVLGGVWTFGYGSGGGRDSDLMTFTKPGQVSPWLTNHFAYDNDELGIPQPIVISQAFADGHSYSYSYAYPPHSTGPAPTVGGSYIDNLGHGLTLTYGFPAVPGSGPGEPCLHTPCAPVTTDDGSNPVRYQQTSGPVTVEDALGRVTTFDYCDPQAAAGLPPAYHNRCYVGPLQSYTDPEGIKTVYTYAGNRNIGEVRRMPKPGSALAPIVTTATYDCALDRIKSCAKPVTSTDARGNVTNYTYSADHGGLLSELQPAPAAGGARPLALYGYVQRYAYVKDAGGALVRAAAPVWLPAGETRCQAAAGSNTPTCDPAAPQLVTTYEYGADGTADDLLVRGKVVSADGQSRRTCYRHDAQGNRIAETSPRAGPATCP